jgi:putative transposase
MKGNSVIHIAQNNLVRKKSSNGMHFWARGYFFVSTVGTDEEIVRAYIREQEKEDHRVE